MLKSSTLTIAVPYGGCDKNCPYCVSKMTGYIKTDSNKMFHNVNKVKQLARSADVTAVLFTGKGEPLVNLPSLLGLASHFQEWPIEVQTNGLKLKADRSLIPELERNRIDTIAISVDSMQYIYSLTNCIGRINEANMNARITVNVNDVMEKEDVTFKVLVGTCKDIGVKQLTLRRLTIPDVNVSEKAAAWIKEHGAPELYNRLLSEFVEMKMTGKAHFIRSTNFGAEIWDCDGVAFTFSDYCIQENHGLEDVRSIIFQEDGHVYTTWDRKASLLF